MRFARWKIALVAMVAAVVVTSTAAAQETAVEAVIEDGGYPCDDTLHQCPPIHIEGESHVAAVSTGARLSVCSDELTATIVNGGNSNIDWTGSADGPPGCNVINCAPPENHWPVTSIGESDFGLVHFYMRFCLRSPANGAELHCDGEVHAADIGASHDYLYSMTALCAGGSRRVEGSWSTEDGPVEFVHQ